MIILIDDNRYDISPGTGVYYPGASSSREEVEKKLQAWLGW